MLDLPYNQFTGTVQVMKAVGNHLVLTFCETLPKSQIFTIILTRKLHLLSREVSIDSTKLSYHAMTRILLSHYRKFNRLEIFWDAAAWVFSQCEKFARRSPVGIWKMHGYWDWRAVTWPSGYCQRRRCRGYTCCAQILGQSCGIIGGDWCNWIS